MTYILFGLGVLFILLGFVDIFPKIKRNYLDIDEIQRWQKQKSEVSQAKEDLLYLLEELRNVSDQAVNSIESKINEAKSIQISNKLEKVQLDRESVSETIPRNGNIKLSNDVKRKDNKDKNNKDITTLGKKLDNKSNNITKDKSKVDSNINNTKENNQILDKHTYIYQLSKQGVSVDEIAQKVQMGKGEVELIIGIKRRGEQA